MKEVSKLSSGESLTSTVIGSAEELPQEWETLRRKDQVALDPRVLKAFEAARIPGVETEYVVLSRDERIVSGAAMHHVEIYLNQQRLPWIETIVRKALDADRADLLRFRAIMCGLNLSQGRDDIVSGNSPPSTEAVNTLAEWAEVKAVEADLDGIIFAHVHEDRRAPFDSLRQRGYVLLPSLGYASLPVAWKGIDEYIKLLRSGHRRQVLDMLSKLKERKLTVILELDLLSHIDEFMPLYSAVLDKAEQRIEVMNAMFFQKLAEMCPQEVGLTGIKNDGRLVAGAVTMRAGSRLCCLEIGLDYHEQTKNDLYINLLLALIDKAGKIGATHLDLGQTALSAKANLGAIIESTWIYVKARSPLFHAALRVERPDFHKPALPQRTVFRNMATEKPSTILEGMDFFSSAGGNWARYVNPDLATFLALLRMDRIYVRGEGHRLWDTNGREIFDAAAGYGALPFGHNPSWLWQEVIKLAGSQRPNYVQGSLVAEAGELAALLCNNAPESIRYCVFANSGAEAVEVAIKAARAATGRQYIIVATGAFHGKTLGALSATADNWFQTPFFAPAPGFIRVIYGDTEDLERALEQHRGSVAAFLVEPIQGEAGVIVPPAEYLRTAAEACARHDVLFLVDEVQTGLGRLGYLFACSKEYVNPDAIILSKALGGGLVPTAACLLSARAWSESLAMRHSSTFAGNTLAATVGLVVVQKLLAENGKFLDEVKRSGIKWGEQLHGIASNTPSISAIRGQGLLYGLEISPLDYVDSPTLRSLSQGGKLVPMLCGYLLNVHGLRVMPPLARKTSLRLIPPLTAPDGLLDLISKALTDMCYRLDTGDLRGLTRFMLGANAPEPSNACAVRRKPPHNQKAPASVAGTFAFIANTLDWQSYREIEPSFEICSDKEIADYERVIRDTAEIVQLSEVVLRSRTGAYCRGWFIGLPFTSRELLSLPPEESLRWVREGVQTAKKLGAKIVGLGAMTSIVTQGGSALTGEGVGITTGNSFTVVAAIESLTLAMQKLGINPTNEVCAVIGATGSIGRACASLCASLMSNVILVGRQNGKDTHERLSKLARDIEKQSDRKLRMQWTTDISEALSQSRIIICATSSPTAVIRPEWLRPGMVICDIARPSDLPPGVSEMCDDILIIDGGIVSLPEHVSLGWNFGFEPGTAFACMAETISLAFDGWHNHYGLGPHGILSTYQDAAERAKRHGFRVLGIRRGVRALSDIEIACLSRNMKKLNEIKGS